MSVAAFKIFRPCVHSPEAAITKGIFRIDRRQCLGVGDGTNKTGYEREVEAAVATCWSVRAATISRSSSNVAVTTPFSTHLAVATQSSSSGLVGRGATGRMPRRSGRGMVRAQSVSKLLSLLDMTVGLLGAMQGTLLVVTRGILGVVRASTAAEHQAV